MKKKKKMTSTWLQATLKQEKERKKSSQTPNHVSFSPISLFLQVAFDLSYMLHLFHYFLFISLFTQFSLFMILFTTFYP